MRAIPVGFFTATGLLMRLRRAKRGRLDAELRQIARARLPVIDEFGYMPIDRTVRHGRLTGFGGRLLPQRARPHDQIAGKERAAGSDGAVSAGNQPPMLLKNSAHTVDANLQKHSLKSKLLESIAAAFPLRWQDSLLPIILKTAVKFNQFSTAF